MKYKNKLLGIFLIFMTILVFSTILFTLFSATSIIIENNDVESNKNDVVYENESEFNDDHIPVLLMGMVAIV